MLSHAPAVLCASCGTAPCPAMGALLEAMGWGCCQGLGVALCSWVCSCLGLGIIQGEAVQGHFQYEYVKRVLKRGIMTGALGCLGF